MNRTAGKTVKILAVDADPAILDAYRHTLDAQLITEQPSTTASDLPHKDGTRNEGREPQGLRFDLAACRRSPDGVHAVSQGLAEDNPFAVAFIDAEIPPGTQGAEMVAQIRKLDPFIEIVITTADCGRDSSALSMTELPGNELLYLQKPFHRLEIRQLARNLASKWLTEQELRRNQRVLESRINERTGELEKLNARLERDIAKRESVEQALRVSEEKFRNIVQNISDFICVHDMNGKVLESNLTFKKYVGYSPEDMTNMYLQHLIPERYLDEFDAYMERIKDRGEDQGCMNITAKDGREVVIEYRNKLVKNPHGEYEVHGLGRDITERLGTELALKKSETLYRMLFEKAGDAIYLLETSQGRLGRIHSANQAAADMHGYTLDELSGLNIQDLHAPQETARANRCLQSILQGRWIQDRIYHRRKDGTCFPAAFSSGLLKLGKESYILGFDRDISEQIEAEEKLRQSEEKYRLLFEHAHDAIFILGSGIIRFANPSTTQLLQYSMAELEGIPCEKLVHENDRQRVMQWLENRLQGKNALPCLSFRAVSRGDKQIWLQTTAIKVIWQGHASLLCFARDITLIKELEQQLNQAQKMEALGTLAGGIAHDFNNILSVIMGYTQLSIMDIPQGGKAQQQLEHVVAASNRAKELISQILTFSRQQEQEHRPVLIRLIVKEALKLLRASIPTTIGFKQAIQNDVDAIMANPTQIHQVLMNLCTNAAHAMKDGGGTLDVRLENVTIPTDGAQEMLQPGPYVRLTVGDTGCGMDETVAAKIFDPYFTTKKPGEGTGLGLSVVHGIVQSLNGKIEVTSQTGEGTRFDVFFPAVVDSLHHDTARLQPAGDR